MAAERIAREKAENDARRAASEARETAERERLAAEKEQRDKDARAWRTALPPAQSKPPLDGRPIIHLKRPVEQGAVRESWSQGRRKHVVLEKVLAQLRTPSNSGQTGDAQVSASF
jgi:hypothetical protein